MNMQPVDNALSPHGGVLVDRVVSDKKQAAEMVDKCSSVLRIGGQAAREVINIAYGFFSPLEGFMTSRDMDSVCKNMTLADGHVWSLPIVLDVSAEKVKQLDAKPGDHVLLEYHNVPFAVMELEDIFTYDKNSLATALYKMDNVDHPGIKQVHSLGDYFLGGKIWLINKPIFQKPYSTFFITPHDLRAKLKTRRWSRTVVYHSNTVPHMGHEWLMKACWFQHHAKAILVMCAVGSKSIGDCIDEALLLAHQELLNAGYFQENGYMTTLFLWDTRHAGSREALLHAIVAKNLGCTGHIFGKNYAHPKEFGDTWEAHFALKHVPDMGIESVMSKEWFYCERCGGITYESFCAHRAEKQPFHSKSVCSLIAAGVKPSKHLLRPEVFDVLIGAADEYGFGDGYVTADYLQKRGPVFTLRHL